MNVKTKKKNVCIPSKFTEAISGFKFHQIKTQSYESRKIQKLIVTYINDKWNNTTIYVYNQMTSTFRNLFIKIENSTKKVGYNNFIQFKYN